MERRFAYDRHQEERPPPGLCDRGTQREHRPCGFRLFQARHYRYRRRQDDESAGSRKRSRTQAAFYCLSRDMEKRSRRRA